MYCTSDSGNSSNSGKRLRLQHSTFNGLAGAVEVVLVVVVLWLYRQQ
jgi:hypothetical protein